ncbi:MAG TPA: hypothetical protein VK956_07360, partial [Verrucomicrobium sp.]|nr:hypothetical protein [Verrucomicrobium sp.]
LAPEIRLFRERRRLELEVLKEAAFRRQYREYSSVSDRQTLGLKLALELAIWLRWEKSGLPVPVNQRLISHLLDFEGPLEGPGVKSWLLVPPLPVSSEAAPSHEVGDWTVELNSEPPFGTQLVFGFKETGGAAAMRKAEAEAPLPGGPSDESRLWLLRSYAEQARVAREQYSDLLRSFSIIENKKEMVQLVRGMGQLFKELEASQLTSLMRLVNAGVLLKGQPFEPVRHAFRVDNRKYGWEALALEGNQKRYAIKLAWEPVSQFTGWEFEVVTRLPRNGQEETVESCRFFYQVDLRDG